MNKMQESREQVYNRILELAGLGLDGGILPPPKDLKDINREPQWWWKNSHGVDR